MKRGSSFQAAVAQTAESQNADKQRDWLRVPAACQFFGVSRSWLYERIASGDIKTASLRRRGAIRGIRMVSRESLASLIEQAAA
jgi:hypothetical protein